MHLRPSRFAQFVGARSNPNRALVGRSQCGEQAVTSPAGEVGDSMLNGQSHEGASRRSAAPGSLSVVAAAGAAARFAGISASGSRSALRFLAPCASAASRQQSASTVGISGQRPRACRIFGGMLRTTLSVQRGGVAPRPNPSLNRTLHGMPALGFISFLPKSAMPFCAGYRERWASRIPSADLA